MEENMKPQVPQAEAAEQEIDLLELVQKLWAERRLIFKWCIIGAIIGLIIGFSIPKEYTTTVKLAPETQGTQPNLGGLGSLASIAGINLGGMSSTDAVSPELYPDIVGSIPFMTSLFRVDVTSADGQAHWTLAEYVSEELRSPWWSAVFGAPFKALGWLRGLFSPTDDLGESIGANVDPFRLTKKESEVVKALQKRIIVSVDKKTQVVSLNVTMQDPLVSAMLTDTVMTHLQNYVTEYRTNKARHDLKFTQQLFDEAQQNYFAAQQRYAQYVDQNQGIVRRSFMTEQERLENEMDLAFNLYNQTAQQLQLAKAKVQESTPVYAVVQPATVPLKASKPSKIATLIGCILLAGAIVSIGVLMKTYHQNSPSC